MTRIVRIRTDLDGYHERRRIKYGSLYIVLHEYRGLAELKSIATGTVITAHKESIEEVSDEKGPQL